MARRTSTASGHHVNGVRSHGIHMNGDAPPPSTLAAQIVQNQTRAGSTQRNGEKATFAGLLHEILHNSDATQEDDLGVNVQLITVVVEAGLSVLTRDDPFAQWDQLLPQARDSLTVIKQTIIRQPEVLFTPIDSEGPQLLLWLVTRLAPVCCRPNCQDLPVAHLLDSITNALEKSTKLWTSAPLVAELVQACVDDAISAFEDPTTSATGYTLSLPPARWIAKLWPQSGNAIALPQDSQARFNDHSQGILLALVLCQVKCARPRWSDEALAKLQILTVRHRVGLQKLGSWESSIVKLISRPRSTVQFQLLYGLLDDIESFKSLSALQVAITHWLAEAMRNGSAPHMEYLSPVILRLISDSQFDTLHEELRTALALWLSRSLPTQQIPESAQQSFATFRQGDLMTDSRFQSAFKELSEPAPATCHRQRTRKRRRLSAAPVLDKKKTLYARIGKLLTGVDTIDLSALPEVAPSVYKSLTEEDQYAVWTILSDLASLDCDKILLAQTINRLLETSGGQQSKICRILSVKTIHAYAQHIADEAFLDLGTSQFGQAILRSLHSSLRELRIAAAYSLPVFLRAGLSEELMARNRQIGFQYLRTLSERNVPGELETLIVAWGQVALISNEKELNLVLLQLVDWLGHPNPVVQGLANSEIETIAEARSQSPEDLFAPYWSSIAVSVVQELHLRPQRAAALCDLLKKDVNTFLLLTQKETVPSLVVHRKKDVLQRIAAARGDKATVQDICLQPRSNMAAILSYLLIQTNADVEDFALQCLTEVAPGFRGSDFAGLVKTESAPVACELLRRIGDQSPNRKSRAYQSFQTFANLSERRPGQTKAHGKSSKTIASFFETHLLGIMAIFSEDLAKSQPSSMEKTRSLNAIAELVTLAKGEVSVGLPQIRACLQSAIEQADLCEAAWTAWLSLLPVLDGDDIVLIADHTFALIVRYWTRFSPDLQQTTHERVANMVKVHNTVINENVMLLPSLSGIPLLSKLSGEIERLQSLATPEARCKAFAKRLRGESHIVVLQTLKELVSFLNANQELVHDAAMSEQAEIWLSDLVRSLLDVTALHANESDEAAELCGRCLGIVGCLDANRVDATRPKNTVLVMSNFDQADEVVKWAVTLLEDILVKAFKSADNARSQGFLAYVMQELLHFCGFHDTTALRPRGTQGNTVAQRWMDMPEHVRTTLTPYLTSRYHITSHSTKTPSRVYPGFSKEVGHSSWLRGLVSDLMLKAKGENAQMVFPLLSRIVKGHDLSVASFLLPYAVTNVVLGGTVSETKGILDEILEVLRSQPANGTEAEIVRLCSESVFSALDYMSLWLQEKKKTVAETRANTWRTGQSPNDFDEIKDQGMIDTIDKFLKGIPAEAMAARAMYCDSYARALFNWEQHIRLSGSVIPKPSKAAEEEDVYSRLLEIYAQIDEPDGLEGISTHLPFLSDEQQATLHARSGRWTAAQSWYELQMAEQPAEKHLQTSLLQCFRETGRYAPLLRYADSFLAADMEDEQSVHVKSAVLPMAAEACYMNNDLQGLGRMLQCVPDPFVDDFDIGLGKALLANNDGKYASVADKVATLRKTIIGGWSAAAGSSLQTCHADLKKLHILYEMEVLGQQSYDAKGTEAITKNFEKRLAAVGSYISDKQNILGIRRAMMQSRKGVWRDSQIGAAWLTTARLARKAGNSESAYNAVLHAYECGYNAARLEEARLLWHDGHKRQAIQGLESAIASGKFAEETDCNGISIEESSKSTVPSGQPQNMLLAKANLMLAKWLDASGQTQTKDMTVKYQYAARVFQRWEKGHYYLGKHYNKLLEAEQALPKGKQSSQLLCGELTRLVVENLLRSIPFGNKYWHETIPKVLTLWLDMGMSVLQRGKNEDKNIFELRAKALQSCHRQFKKYFDRVPPYIFYQALPQMLSRISHPHPDVWKELSQVITKITSTHPSQALWRLLAVAKAQDPVRHSRAMEIINRLKDPKTKGKTDGGPTDLRMLIVSGQRLADGLLQASEASVEARATQASLSRDLGFSHKLAPCNLVVPLETTLTASVPNAGNSNVIRSHKAFAQDKVTIQGFEDDVRVLSSLQRPKKVTARGSDGKRYSLLCKPKDDLRKDQRLMEFNGVINRALKRDAESSKRQLSIKTYAVIPLSEESGILEWVEGITPIRDILLNLYARKNVRPNYGEIRNVLNESSKNPDRGKGFVEKILPQFEPTLHEWFSETYPEPEKWFAARVCYARTAAVMSMTGHVLGLGDRHGENILLREGTGGVFHVDFNCLFDKGLTFEKPELVPFRLTRNMVDAMGPYGYEGPFRRSCELTLGLLRQNKDTLNTILETFLYDPTTDFIGKKKRHTEGVPETPQEILDSVQRKLKGLFKQETVPLSVEGYADALIKDAVDPWNLSQMYIGWCAFL